MRTTLVALAFVSLAAPALAKKKPPAPTVAAAAPKVAGEVTTKAVTKLMGNFKWGMSSEEAMKILVDDLHTKFDERIKNEKTASRQDQIRAELNEAVAKLRDGHVKFDGKRTGWDVSLIDKEFSHGNDESMLVLWEKDQRRFLFFWNNKLWKQFIAFNADHPKFAGKSFDDFTDIIQGAYGPSSVTFKKQRTSDEQTFDHLEWNLTGDYLLWAIDMTTLYNNFCLSVMQKSVLPDIEKSRKEHTPEAHQSASSLVDAVTKPETAGGDSNVDVVDEITGRQTTRTNQGAPASSSPAKAPARAVKKKGKAEVMDDDKM